MASFQTLRSAGWISEVEVQDDEEVAPGLGGPAGRATRIKVEGRESTLVVL